jgi:hypothetical protein
MMGHCLSVMERLMCDWALETVLSGGVSRVTYALHDTNEKFDTQFDKQFFKKILL